METRWSVSPDGGRRGPPRAWKAARVRCVRDHDGEDLLGLAGQGALSVRPDATDLLQHLMQASADVRWQWAGVKGHRGTRAPESRVDRRNPREAVV